MTIIGLTFISGDAVMNIIIFSGEELNFEQRIGHNIRILFNEELSIANNSGPEKTFPGSPCCHFRGKLIPALTTSSSKGSIISEILTTAFKQLDDLGVYNRSPDIHPFDLFDAHDSRLQAPFLHYIHDPAHKWTF